MTVPKYVLKKNIDFEPIFQFQSPQCTVAKCFLEKTSTIKGHGLWEKMKQNNIFLEQDTTQTQSSLESPGQVGPYVTSYVCLLVPRFDEQALSGDLADQLYSWMKDICISFGWQLKFIDVKPDYFHWIMIVSITTSPTQFMKTICQESSNKIFDEFPKFKTKNMSNEFWAPWNFVGIGEIPYSKDSIQTLINQIRMEQGLQ